MRTLIITGGSFQREFAVSFLKQNSYDYIISVDNGERYARELGLIPDLLIGDFDTRGRDGLEEYERLGKTVHKLTPEKDDTDTEAAIREAVHRGNPVDILCGTGGRIDHLLGNIHNLKIAMDAGVEARLIDAANVIMLKKESFSLKKCDFSKQYVSFMPFSGEVTDLTLKGFKYPLNGYYLKPGISICISNELVEEVGVVSFTHGCLIVMNTSDVESE